uniref:Uncharacterized protein n=1 Tax=Parascaris equorum TaxID=6256 RepID=A0A914RJQ2_PAREQ
MIGPYRVAPVLLLIFDINRKYRFQFGKRDGYRPLQFGKKSYRPLQFGKRGTYDFSEYTPY